jgi:hypothetical protein
VRITEMTDDKLVLNPGAGPLGPGERAAWIYQDQRGAAPLPGVGTEWHLVRPLHPVTCGLPSHIIGHAESPEYAVELLFLPYRADDGGPPDRPLTGGFQLEFFRKDFATPTDLESEAIARLFCGPAFGPVFTLGRDRYRVLDGDPGDRPFPTKTLCDDHPDVPSGPLVRVIHCVLHDTPAPTPAGTGEAEEEPWGFEFPVVWKDNTRTALKHDLRRALKRRLRTLRVVHDWLRAHRLLECPHGGIDADEQEEALRVAADAERRYGEQRLGALAGLPPAGSCPPEEWRNKLTDAATEVRGQLMATARLLRLLRAGQF